MCARTHEYEIACACGSRWRLEASEEPELAKCASCGAHAFAIFDLGQVRPADDRGERRQIASLSR
jgi:hypothetical protein